jgi:hypothetical protein
MSIVFLPSNNDDDFSFIELPKGDTDLNEFLAKKYHELGAKKDDKPASIILDVVDHKIDDKVYTLFRATSSDWKTVYCNDLINNSLNCLNPQCFVMGDVFILVKKIDAEQKQAYVQLNEDKLVELKGDFEQFDLHSQFKRFIVVLNKDGGVVPNIGTDKLAH